jgi:hypothetical protein
MKHHDTQTKEPSPYELARKLFFMTAAGVLLYGLAVVIFVR